MGVFLHFSFGLNGNFLFLKSMGYEELFRFYNSGGHLTRCAEPS
jgi:hypothetical protein